MQIRVVGRHVEVPAEVKEYVSAKAEKLTKHYDRIHEVDVVLGQEKEQFFVEIIVHADHRHTFIAREVGADTHVLIDTSIEKLGRQLTKHKEKVRTRKGGTSADGATG
ncbi:MAG: ribosome-associated translation inhibitor RaiA [Planctomycetes bacterium]|nr:ribosome-associated translation inhibitor RaiA [Planctomycetota bacterium]MBI3835222.1 ribosome-associated translation inhibitor RaiA [Planctomycetota bacterium]